MTSLPQSPAGPQQTKASMHKERLWGSGPPGGHHHQELAAWYLFGSTDDRSRSELWVRESGFKFCFSHFLATDNS